MEKTILVRFHHVIDLFPLVSKGTQGRNKNSRPHTILGHQHHLPPVIAFFLQFLLNRFSPCHSSPMFPWGFQSRPWRLMLLLAIRNSSSLLILFSHLVWTFRILLRHRFKKTWSSWHSFCYYPGLTTVKECSCYMALAFRVYVCLNITTWNITKGYS